MYTWRCRSGERRVVGGGNELRKVRGLRRSERERVKVNTKAKQPNG